EEDVPDKIIAPRGFQAIEALLFGKWKDKDYTSLWSLTDFLLADLKKLQDQPDRSNQFSDEGVFDAMRASLLKCMVLGITGFDSPLANYSLPETAANLQGVDSLLAIYRSRITEKDKRAYTEFSVKIKEAVKELFECEFNSFDRLAFLREHMMPLYA